MSSNDPNERTGAFEEVEASHGTKRDADSLFMEAVADVDADEHLDDTGNRGE